MHAEHPIRPDIAAQQTAFYPMIDGQNPDRLPWLQDCKPLLPKSRSRRPLKWIAAIAAVLMASSYLASQMTSMGSQGQESAKKSAATSPLLADAATPARTDPEQAKNIPLNSVNPADQAAYLRTVAQELEKLNREGTASQ